MTAEDDFARYTQELRDAEKKVRELYDAYCNARAECDRLRRAAYIAREAMLSPTSGAAP